MEGTKWCSKCGEVKPLEGFSKHKSTRDKYQSWCKSCFAAYDKNWRTPERSRKKSLKYLYGITPETYEVFLVSQDRCCKICGKHEDDELGSLCVDHDHNTGKVRGLLCQNCNLAIGKLGDSPETVLKAHEYLLHNGASVDAALAAIEGEATGVVSSPDPCSQNSACC